MVQYSLVESDGECQKDSESIPGSKQVSGQVRDASK